MVKFIMTTFSLVIHLGAFMSLNYSLGLGSANFFDQSTYKPDYFTKKHKVWLIENAVMAAAEKANAYAFISCLEEAYVSNAYGKPFTQKTPGGLSGGNFPIFKNSQRQIYGKKELTELRSDGVHKKQRLRSHSRC